MKTLVVTGSHGFIGKALIDGLNQEAGATVIKLAHNDNFDNFENLHKDKEIDCFYVLGWGGISGPDRQSISCQTNNISYLKQILNLISKLKVKKIFFASSVAELEFIKAIFKENDLPPISLYGSAKLFAHCLVRSFCEKNNITCCFGYISAVYGPGEVSSKLICSSIQKLAISNEKLYFSKGDQLFDFVYIDDLVADLKYIGVNPDVTGQYLIGSGEYIPLRNWLEDMCDVFDKNSNEFREFSNISGGESLDLKEISWINIDFLSNIKNLPRTPFKKGIENTANFLKEVLGSSKS
jgi:nucleoside-diphosphate-sugar epimerase